MTVPERLHGQETPRRTPYLRPKDAATLLLLEGTGADTRLLMGRRRKDLAFMPGKYVFPGGRVDPADKIAPSIDDLDPVVTSVLINGMRGKPSARRARALALAAVRETFEETGHLLGEKNNATAKVKSRDWQEFLDHGVTPSLASLRVIARATTPPGRPRRFDTRFFVANANAVAVKLPLEIAGDGELEDLCWLTVPEAMALDLPRITHVVLELLHSAISQETDLTQQASIPYFYMRHGRFEQDTIHPV